MPIRGEGSSGFPLTNIASQLHSSLDNGGCGISKGMLTLYHTSFSSVITQMWEIERKWEGWRFFFLGGLQEKVDKHLFAVGCPAVIYLSRFVLVGSWTCSMQIISTSAILALFIGLNLKINHIFLSMCHDFKIIQDFSPCVMISRWIQEPKKHCINQNSQLYFDWHKGLLCQR